MDNDNMQEEGAPDLSDSSWGQKDATYGVVTLRRYNQILRTVDGITEVFFFIGISLIPVLFIYLVTSTNFENLIFFDGTSLTCYLDGKTGKVVNPYNTGHANDNE